MSFICFCRGDSGYVYMRLHFARKQKNSYRLSWQTMEVFTCAQRNEIEFRAIFISVNLTEMNIHFGCVNADDLKATRN